MFTIAEMKFLGHHGISTDEVIDVRDMRPCVWKGLAKDEGYDFVLCSSGLNCDHRIKTRHNACCQCNPAAISFMKRHERPGWVYIAHSVSKDLVKIGTTENPKKRQSSLRSQGYGDATDWSMIGLAYVEHGGASEWRLWYEIEGQPVVAGYQNRHTGGNSRELLICDPRVALKKFLEVVDELKGENVIFDSSYIS